MHITASVEIFTRGKFSLISPPALIGEISSHYFFLSCIRDCIEDMVTFTALAKLHSWPLNFLEYKGIAGFGEFILSVTVLQSKRANF